MSRFFADKLAPFLPKTLAEKEAAEGRISKLRTVSEILGDLVDAVKDTDLPDAVARLSPWAEAVGSATAEAVPPVKFLVKLFENLGRIDDPPTLGYLACCLAYQHALEKAIAHEPRLRKIGKIQVRKDLRLKENAGAYDFTGFSLERALQHAFVQDADQSLRQVLMEGLGLDKDLASRLAIEVRTHFVSELLTILSDRGTSERFEPFYRFLQLRPTALDAYADLRNHAEYQRRLFEEQPVLGVEPFALQHVYVDLDCGDLAWGEIDRERAPQRDGPLDPFNEKNGGRHGALDTVLRYIADPEFKEAIVIQGPAGAGKSTFTLCLCCALAEHGLRPIRVELKNLATRETKDPWEALPEAVELDEKRHGFADLFLRNRIFEERLPFRFAQHETEICPYVLILDGWDEISSSASQGYQQELNRLLAAVRDELFRRTDGKVRVILAGRPTGVVGQSVLVNARTRVLTLRNMTSEQLENLIESFRFAANRRPLPSIQGEPWNLEHANEALAVIRDRYTEENGLEVLGLPLLAYLTLRLAAENPETAQKVVDDTTALYRSLVDLVVQRAGKPDYGRTREKDEPVVTGDDLRRLLQDTAAAMTALDARNISREELGMRLRKSFDQLDREVQALGEEQVLGRLLISFFFKGGHPELGCEFSHKSFREYLFAEKIVERLKFYGRQARPNLPLRASGGKPYWQDFSPNTPGDGRYELSRDLLEHLGPQWLQPEELAHLERLLAWEIGRAKDTAPGLRLGQPTVPLDRVGWCVIRDGLADLWDWWGEGVHLRPLPQRDPFEMRIERQKPLAAQHAEASIWRSRQDSIQTPIRVITLDGHLGDALFSLCTIIHAQLIDRQSIQVHAKKEFIRPYQVQQRGVDNVHFTPSGKDRRQFLFYIARVNACGFHPRGFFPWNASAAFIDLSDAVLVGTTLLQMNLSDVNLSDSDLKIANLLSSKLPGANLCRSDLANASLAGTDLSGADLSGANLSRADLSEANLSGANLSKADLSGAILTHARGLAPAMLQKSIGCPLTLPDGTSPRTDEEYRARLEQLVTEFEQRTAHLTPPTRPE